jgi:hypothetical protein
MTRRFPFLLSLVFMTGCATLRSPRLPSFSLSGQTPGHAMQSGWPAAGQIQPGERIAIYLDSGRRFEHIVVGPDAGTDLDMNGIRRDDVVAIARAPKERLIDGVLVGMASGAGVAMGWGAKLAEEDFSGDVAAVSAVYGVAAGAGIGALLDAGFANAEKPVYVRPAPGLGASSPRKLNLSISPVHVGNWVRGRKVELMLEDGTYMKGTVRSAVDRVLELAVRDSSDRSRKGKTLSLPVESISAITYRENVGGNRASAGFGGALTGFFTGTLMGGSIGYDSADETPLVVGAAVGLTLGTLTGLGLAEHYNWREVTLSVR